MEKRAYKPNTVILNLKDDLGLTRHDVNVEFWKDPSREVCFSIMSILRADIETMTPDEVDKMNRNYFECASLLLIDCEIEGLDFSTPESTERAFHHKGLPWGIFHEAIIAYISYLTTEYQVLKNALRRVLELSNSGTEKSDKESE